MENNIMNRIKVSDDLTKADFKVIDSIIKKHFKNNVANSFDSSEVRGDTDVTIVSNDGWKLNISNSPYAGITLRSIETSDDNVFILHKHYGLFSLFSYAGRLINYHYYKVDFPRQAKWIKEDRERRIKEMERYKAKIKEKNAAFINALLKSDENGN